MCDGKDNSLAGMAAGRKTMTHNRDTPHWHLFGDQATLAEALADHVAGALRRNLERQESVTLLVSGGRSPARFFECLAQREADWARVWVVPLDERTNALELASRNDWLIRHHLMNEKAFRGHLVALDQPVDGPAITQRLPWPPALAVLGMGEDGHCASWFPGDRASMAALQDGQAPGVIATRAHEAPTGRLTLNWPALAEAGERVLLITGNTKRALLERIEAQDASWQQYPVARLLSAPLTVFWSP